MPRHSDACLDKRLYPIPYRVTISHCTATYGIPAVSYGEYNVDNVIINRTLLYLVWLGRSDRHIRTSYKEDMYPINEHSQSVSFPKSLSWRTRNGWSWVRCPLLLQKHCCRQSILIDILVKASMVSRARTNIWDTSCTSNKAPVSARAPRMSQDILHHGFPYTKTRQISREWTTLEPWKASLQRTLCLWKNLLWKSWTEYARAAMDATDLLLNTQSTGDTQAREDARV